MPKSIPAAPEPPTVDAPAQEAPVEDSPVEEYVAPEEPVPAPPVLCPAGTTSQANDGYNDTACLPDECMSGIVGDGTRPQCDVAFRP